MSKLHTLNKEQLKAVHATEGRLLVLAGAGSGKTSVLTMRMAHLISSGKALPENILGLTFTNKAAKEMKQRLGELIGASLSRKVMLCTFHSFCMYILRLEIEALGYTKNFSLYDERDIKRLITHLARESLEHESELPSLTPTIDQIKQAKTQGAFSKKETPNWHDSFSEELFHKLQTSMRAHNAVDFDSLLTLTVELFETFPQVLEKYQKRFRYIMIDEYQDTNPIQYQLAQAIASGSNNLCVVGDDDQSIYGWRGASIENILNFKADQTIKLEQNYRSTTSILEAANRVISKNENRHEKRLWTSKNRTTPIEIFHAPDEEEEVKSVVNRMLKIRQEMNLKWSDFAILYRSNTLARPFESALLKTMWQKEDRWIRGIPYQIFGGTEMTEKSEVKDVLAYMRVLANPLDQEALLRIINFPRRGISDKTLDELRKLSKEGQKPLFTILTEIKEGVFSNEAHLTRHALKGITSFITQFDLAKQNLNKYSLSKAFTQFMETIEIKKAVQDEVKSDKMKTFKGENIDFCLELLKSYEEETSSPSLPDFVSSTLLDQSKFQGKKKEHKDSVSLMTFHSAKGLEFPVCFLIALEDHLIPHEKSLKESGIEEERRLFYVAITRAKEHLILSMAQKRDRFGKASASAPSRFLYDIPKSLLNITPHKIF
ncbi:MAG: UvrD-helicase domain-containing protein [Simkaniaceae bacterium]